MSNEAAVVVGYLKAAGWVAAAFIAAWIGAQLASRFAPSLIGKRVRTAAFLLGSGMLLVATIGGLGWAIQTSDGTSPAEILNQTIFKFLSIGGAFLLVFDYYAAANSAGRSPPSET